jgi:glycosyltransferase involved in cell wall biosynthesis
MKILHIISSGGMYGAEAVILNLSRTLNENSHSSILGVFSNFSNPNLQLHESALKEEIESNLIPCDGQIDRTVTTSIRELVERTGADIVHAHGYKADVYAYIALRRTRTPFVSTCHNWIKDNLLVSLYGVVDRFVLRSYSGVIAVSDEVKSRLLEAGVSKEKIHLIQNGIDLRPFVAAAPSLRMGGAEDALTIGWIGRLSHEKGPDIFLRAACRVLSICPSARFIVVGDGPDIASLGTLMDELKMGNSVSFVGRREDMPSVYASLDIMVSSSRQEGLPMAILEGMASGLPLVATAVGDVSTVVLNGQTGILVPSENVEELAAAMVDLLQSKSLRERFSIAAKKLIEEKFSAEQMATNYLKVYSKAIESEKRSVR